MSQVDDYSVTHLPTPERVGVFHTVKRGETLWRIAKTYGIRVSELTETNEISNSAQVKAGQKIFIPGTTTEKEVLIDEEQSRSDFVWPVRGKVIRYFQQNYQGRMSKGIDIKANPGDIVRATRTGRVVFADDLPGYGTTVILDHMDGFYTVYSQNEELRVHLGDLVLKNNEIATLGPTEDLALLHFEVRRNAIEDNPLYYLP